MNALMKKTILFATVLAAFALLALSCQKDPGLSTDQYDAKLVTLNAYGPQPVVRGGTLRFIGSNLDKVVSVTIPGVAPLTPEVITAGTHSEIRVTVPKDGPEPGYPVLTLSDGSTLTGKTPISYSEPITISEITPLSVYPGDVVTIKGDYLNLIHEVVFTKDVIVSETNFKNHGRYEISLVVPVEARTGILSLGTVDETTASEDLLATLNLVPSESELVVGTASGSIPSAAIKAGEEVTVSGSHLDLVTSVSIGLVTITEFVQQSGTKLSFILPDNVGDNEVILNHASGVEVPAGTLTTVVPAELAAAPSPVKNLTDLTITGKDLDLVTGLSFPHAADAEFAYADGKITVNVPEAAQEGNIVLALANGKSVEVSYTLVKPAVTGFSANPASAGSGVTVNGTDLDLVAAVTFFPDIKVEVAASESEITVAVPTAAESGIFVLNLKNGTSVETVELAIDKPAGAYIPVFPEDLYAPGAMFIVDIENPDHLTGVEVDGTPVNYILNGNTLYLSIPESARRGSQLTLVSDNGSVTYTMNIDPGDIIETTLWTGNLPIAGWANNEMRDNLIFTGVEMKPGQQVRFYGEFADWWCVQIFDGHWGELVTGYNDEKPHMVSARVVPEAKEQGFFALTLTPEMIEKLQTYTDWGYWGIIQGEGLTLTKITYYEDNSDGTEIWKGPLEITWNDGGRVALPKAAFQVAKVGQKLRLFYTQKDQTWAQAQINDGAWSTIAASLLGLPENPIVPTNTYGWFSDGILDRCDEITLTQELIDHLLSVTGDYEGVECSIIIQGSDLIFNKVTIK